MISAAISPYSLARKTPSAAQAAAAEGATRQYAAVMHLTGPALRQLQNEPALERLFVTDTVEHGANSAGTGRVTSVAPELAQILAALDGGRRTSEFEFIENP